MRAVLRAFPALGHLLAASVRRDVERVLDHFPAAPVVRSRRSA